MNFTEVKSTAEVEGPLHPPLLAGTRQGILPCTGFRGGHPLTASGKTRCELDFGWRSGFTAAVNGLQSRRPPHPFSRTLQRACLSEAEGVGDGDHRCTSYGARLSCRAAGVREKSHAEDTVESTLPKDEEDGATRRGRTEPPV